MASPGSSCGKGARKPSSTSERTPVSFHQRGLGFGLILSGEELATDKVLAIFGRAEPRDFVDLAALEPRYGLSRLLEQAAEKDPGFQLAVFRQMLDRFHRLERDEFDVDSAGYRSVAQSVARWMTFVDQAAHDRGREDPNG